MIPLKTRFFLSLAFSIPASGFLQAATVSIQEATIAELNSAFQVGTLTSVKLTEIYLKRIEAYDQKGPKLNTVIALNSAALAEAAVLDAERKQGKLRGPLHGIPVVLKDNFDTYDMPTTAGSQLLEGSVPPDDAFVVKQLRAAGAIILAKVNLSEFAGGGGSMSGATDKAMIAAGTVPNGYSSIGGQTFNPHDLTRGPAGSSGGTGAALAAAFSQIGLGTDTGGSIRGPSAANGVVGLKPTHGLMSRDGIVPLALTFDTGGPMARSVYDVAIALGVMTGVDSADPATMKSEGKFEKNYLKYLRKGSLKGARIGVARGYGKIDPETERIFGEAVATLSRLGATVIEDVRFPDYMLQPRAAMSTVIRNAEFKAQIGVYLSTLKPGFPRTLAELVSKANDPQSGYRSPEKAYALRYSYEQALELDDPLYLAAKNEGLALIKSATEAVFSRHQLDAIVYPTFPEPATPIKNPAPAISDNITRIANQTGFPDLSVPAGMTKDGLPVTLSFLGREFSEAKLFGYGFDYEQASKARVNPKNTPPLSSDTITY